MSLDMKEFTWLHGWHMIAFYVLGRHLWSLADN